MVASESPRPTRVVRRCLVAALLCAATVVAAPAPAGAQAVDALCTGTIEQSWSPGLKLYDQTVTYTAELDFDCESSDPDVDGAAIHAHAQYPINCLGTVDIGVPTTVEWNTGETSDITVNVVGVSTGGGAEVFEFLGSVDAGKFAGDTVQMLNTFVSLDVLACLTPQGMTHRSGTTVLTLLDL